MGFRNVVTDAAPLRRATLLAAAVLAGTPFVAEAAPRHDTTPASSAAATAGVVYGGVTAAGFGLMVEVNKSRSKIVRMHIGLPMQCTSGAFFAVPDNWTNLRVSKQRKFSASFGPEVQRNDDGTTTDTEGTVRGRFNSSRSSVSGTWSLKLTHRDAAATVMDTCDSGSVNWKAKQ
jgi:hypothetical protein